MIFTPGRLYLHHSNRGVIFFCQEVTDQRAFGYWLNPDGTMRSKLADSVRAYETSGWVEAKNLNDAVKLLRGKPETGGGLDA